MAKLEWDKTGQKFYETGVDHGVLYTGKPGEGDTGKYYASGVAWNGLTSVTESPSGAEANDIYADNILYASLRSAEKFGGTIEAYMYPEEFCVCNGEKSPTNVTGVYVGQQAREKFGFCYRSDVGEAEEGSIDTEKDYKLHLWYNCTASPSERQYQTINDSPEAITMSWEISTTPVTLSAAGFKPTALIVIDTSKLTTQGKTNLATLETMLYGGENASAYMPTPDVVITTMSATQ